MSEQFNWKDGQILFDNGWHGKVWKVKDKFNWLVSAYSSRRDEGITIQKGSEQTKMRACLAATAAYMEGCR